MSPKSNQAIITDWGKSSINRTAIVFAPMTVARCCIIFELVQRERKSVRIVGRTYSPGDQTLTSNWAALMMGVSGMLNIDTAAKYPTATFRVGDIRLQHQLDSERMFAAASQFFSGLYLSGGDGDARLRIRTSSCIYPGPRIRYRRIFPFRTR